ncbi:long-chain fatty acid--CoA ligase, partial [Candidatus Bathyarchaeota archaeon]|nr:long-chain fatty acid--CoA ligase [Candidatus Bathyarchaeota archaeon]
MSVPSNRPWFKFWPKDVPKHVDFPEIPLFQILKDSATKYPNRVAFTFLDRSLTYKELDHLTDRFATALSSMSKKGDRTILFVPNIPEHVIGYYGISKAGGIVSSISPLSKEIELEHHINSIEAETIIVDVEHLPIVKNVQAKTTLKNVILTGNKEFEGTLLFNKLVEQYPASPPKLKINPREDVAAIQFTGGTTGMPKGAMMTHWNLVSNAIMNTMWFKWTENDVVLDVLPLYHTWGACACMHSPIYVGARVILFERPPPPPNVDLSKSRVAPDIELWLQVIEKEKATVWYGAATMFIVLVNYPDLGKFNLHSLRYVKIGAMPIPTECKRKWEEITGVPMILGYGLTEASPETHSSPPERVKPGTIGIPIIDTDAKIVDEETGKTEISLGGTGELIIKGPQVMKGYWEDEAKTKESIKDGWLYTGDIAKMDEDGYFYIVDRKKDLIKYKGYSVYSAEVEDVLYKHPAVKECAVVGIPDDDLTVGERPKAFIVLKPGYEPSKALADEITKFCSDRIAPYKRIREVEFIPVIPKTPVGKVLKRQLRDRD